jgi:hypothetical protein
MIRDALLRVFASAWFVVVVISAWRTEGDVPPELWTVLGIGVGSLLALFRIDEGSREGGRHRREDEE